MIFNDIQKGGPKRTPPFPKLPQKGAPKGNPHFRAQRARSARPFHHPPPISHTTHRGWGWGGVGGGARGARARGIENGKPGEFSQT